MHHARGVHDDLDLVEVNPEKQMCLDHLKALVDQGRGVDRHHRAHIPGRMIERLLGGDLCELRTGPAPEGSATRGQHQSSYFIGATRLQALGQRAVLAVDRHDLAGLGATSDHRATDDQRLLVSQSQRVAGIERRDGRPQPDSPGDAVEHHRVGHQGSLDTGLLPQA